ncbi:UvrD-helicase-domain-containing protein [Polychaeton citri CBS 116435]|uniref:DNA 3'-5' helicase n=1 Tax=Polychaeton citri CBS 116435 TaxID=1314669 RepID=A0A9P4Q9B9_9PEZI|nr:UvrD-helicase-domain-containing protein [Polychaeton citri CBS 116435]
MTSILKGLNDAQKAAVLSGASVLQVLAPPGSGKTKTLTTRVAHLISDRQLKPWNIIVCTFTVKAAREMKERIRGFVGEGLEKKLILGTFHSIALRYLKSYGQLIGLDKDFAIADTADSKAILRRIVKKNGFTIEPGAALGRISKQKAEGIDSEQYICSAKNIEQREFSQIYSEYESVLAASKLLDYDDLLLRCRFLLMAHPQCVSNVQAVLIDEFQDTNTIQYDLMGLFAQKMHHITIVGDPDQSIYGFRSAEIKNLGRMKEQWPDTLTINLQENYRSSGAILHAAQKIIEQDESRPAKKLQATHSLGLRPVLRKLPTAYAEAEWLVTEIKRTQALSGTMLQPSDFAVLLRSAALSRPLESAMGKAGIPYRMVGGTKFFDRAEVKVLIDYLRVVDQPQHSEAVERIVNVPSRKIGDATLKGLQEGAQKRGVSLWRHIVDVARRVAPSAGGLSSPAHKGLSQFMNVILSLQQKAKSAEQVSVVDLLNLLIKKVGFQDYLKTKYGEDHETRWTNVEELLALAAEATSPEKLTSLAEEDTLPTIEDVEQRSQLEKQDILSSFLANIALTSSPDQKAEGDIPLQQVVISTIHAAKGLEWPVVFIPACYEGSIPHSRADDNDEERRLLYVGMTRAQALLYLSCPIKNAQKSETTISSFLTQSGVNAFFENHGPSLPRVATRDLSVTLRRTCPSVSEIAESSLRLERDEDDWWPLDGEEKAEERAKWDSASTTMKAGFVSAASRYTEEVEKHREEAQLRRIESRAAGLGKQKDPEVKGRKRHIEGQGSIAGFLKRQRSCEEVSQASRQTSTAEHAHDQGDVQPLDDITNVHQARQSGLISPKMPVAPLRKMRSAPLERPTKNGTSTDDLYVFLSSSPTRLEHNDYDRREIDAKTHPHSLPSLHARNCFKPASTFHTTSMQKIGQPVRKTLGVKRSMNGWANRGHK